MTEPNAQTQQDAPAPKPGSPEYDQMMAEKFRGAQGAVDASLLAQFEQPAGDQGNKPVRPDHIPEKFWDPETGQVRVDDLLKSYTELESSKGKTSEQTPDPATQKSEEDAAKDVVEKAGLDWDTLGNKLMSAGNLDASDYEAIEKLGIPREIAERYVQLLTAENERLTQESVAYAGGKEAIDQLFGWAAKNLSPAEIEGYNKMLASADWKVAIDTLKTRYAKASPTAGEPNLIVPKSSGSGTTVGYQTEDEMKADMRDPRYFQQTPAGAKFRAEVAEKVRLAAFRRK